MHVCLQDYSVVICSCTRVGTCPPQVQIIMCVLAAALAANRRLDCPTAAFCLTLSHPLGA